MSASVQHAGLVGDRRGKKFCWAFSHPEEARRKGGSASGLVRTGLGIRSKKNGGDIDTPK